MSTTFTNPAHTDRILQNMWKRCKNAELCDVVLIDGYKVNRIPAHRSVLSEVSEYFNEIFTTSALESTLKTVEIPNVCGNILQRLIEYCYIGCVVISTDNVVELLKTACTLHLRDVVKACENFMIKQLNPSNCLEFVLLAAQCHCELLLHRARKFSREHIMDLSKTTEFLRLNAEELSQLLACADQCAAAEADVFNSLKTWLEHEPIEREQHKVELLKLVRMPLLERSFLMNDVKSICTSVECLQIYMEALEMIVSADSTMLSGGNLTESANSHQVLLGITGNDTKIFIHHYCTQRHKWMKWLKELKYREASGVALMKNCLYCIETYNADYNSSNSVICLNLDSMTLTEISPMIEHRSRCCLAVLNGFLYVIGGYRDYKFQSSVEKWNPETNKWSKVASMSTGRLNFGVGVLNQKLYVVGGFTNWKILNSAECYNPVQDVWQNIAPMSERRHLHKVAAANGLLYAVGGSHTKTAECYNPQTNKWTSICSLREEIFPNRSCITLHDKVIVSQRDHFDEYDIKTNKWKMLEGVKYLDNCHRIFSYSGKMLTSQFTEIHIE